MPPSANVSVRFNRDYTVDNGTGNPKGPEFKAGKVYSLPPEQADFWNTKGIGTIVTGEEAARPIPVIPPKLSLAGAPGAPSMALDLDSMKSADLVALADREKIDLGNASKKSEIVDRIKAARADREAAAKAPPQASGTLPPPITTEPTFVPESVAFPPKA